MKLFVSCLGACLMSSKTHAWGGHISVVRRDRGFLWCRRLAHIIFSILDVVKEVNVCYVCTVSMKYHVETCARNNNLWQALWYRVVANRGNVFAAEIWTARYGVACLHPLYISSSYGVHLSDYVVCVQSFIECTVRSELWQ